MSLECGCDDGIYVEIPDDLETCQGTLFCGECRRLIPAGEPYYRTWTWGFNEDGEEFTRDINEVCEVCGDLAINLLERGFCWYFGELRYDIQTLHEMETG